ncbi:conserved exported hypothetical protein [Verrucomicrobia bacterium]|nr:conserved exported hypothetical protein [Verrucomicrobiota bacterium]
MSQDNPGFARSGQSRREFIKKTSAVSAGVAGASFLQIPVSAEAQGTVVAIVLDASDSLTKTTPVQWATAELRDTLVAHGLPAQFHQNLDQVSSTQPCILVGGAASISARQVLEDAGIRLPASPESLALARGHAQGKLVALTAGRDERGLVYALLELADRVRYADNPLAVLKGVQPVCESPANEIRGVARSFVSDVEDKPWFNDKNFWPPYLTMLAAQRFNWFHLALGIGYDSASDIRDCYLHFPYPFLLETPGYDVRATPLTESERDHNLEMLRFISDETARRGLRFQLGLWTHAYQWIDSPNANYRIEGLNPETHAPYCRDALRALLKACPSISGVTFRIHGESGVPEGNYELWKTIFDGVVTCGRPVRIDMHAKGMDQGMIDVALGTGLPVSISPKYWAEHMGLPYMQGAIRPLEMPRAARTSGLYKLSSGSRSFLRYGYGDLLAEDRRYAVLHRMWPGTQRMLLWGCPEMAAAYGRASSFCGSVGAEICEPLSFKGRGGSGLPVGREGYADGSLRCSSGDFEKFNYWYRVWGHSLYNPDGNPDGFRRLLRHQFGRGAEKAEAALASASRILPLVTTAHLPSAANRNFWPEMYSHMPIVDASRPHPYGDTPAPRRLGTVSPLDPEFFLGLDEFVEQLLSGKRNGKYSPAWVAQQLEHDAKTALDCLREAKSTAREPGSVEFRRLAIDVAIQAGLGRFFASKLRAGMLYSIYLHGQQRPAMVAAIKANRAARTAWVELADKATPYSHDVTYGNTEQLRGHWLDRVKLTEEDIADMERVLEQPLAITPKLDARLVELAMREVLAPPPRGDVTHLEGFHTPPPFFVRGQPVAITASVSTKTSKLTRVRLRYRRINQAEAWQSVEMEPSPKGYRAEIPGAYSDSRFPLQYHFELELGGSVPELYPGLKPGWHGQPYFLVRQSAYG